MITKRVKYKFGKKPKKHTKLAIAAIVLALIGLAAGLYTISIPLAPRFANNHAKEAAASQPVDDRLIIVSADINAPYFVGGPEVLNKGVWHRFPERGDPEHGGNFILAGHRFAMRGSLKQTINRSRFYNVDKVKEGDPIIIHWKGKKYEYKVVKKYIVKPDQTEIENPSKEPKLTIYTCTSGGTSDGRVVIEAVPITNS